MAPLSCLYSYQKKLFNQDGTVVMCDDGKTPRTNTNYISFLQVISCYWDVDSAGKNKLNIFLNGGSITRDGQSKPGYTVIIPEFLGVPFIDQFYNWSRAFGLSSNAPQRQMAEHDNNREPRRGRRVNVDEFVDPSEVASEAVFE